MWEASNTMYQDSSFTMVVILILRETWSRIYVAVIESEHTLTIRLLDAHTIKLLDSSIIPR